MDDNLLLPLRVGFFTFFGLLFVYRVPRRGRHPFPLFWKEFPISTNRVLWNPQSRLMGICRIHSDSLQRAYTGFPKRVPMSTLRLGSWPQVLVLLVSLPAHRLPPAQPLVRFFVSEPTQLALHIAEAFTTLLALGPERAIGCCCFFSPFGRPGSWKVGKLESWKVEVMTTWAASGFLDWRFYLPFGVTGAFLAAKLFYRRCWLAVARWTAFDRGETVAASFSAFLLTLLMPLASQPQRRPSAECCRRCGHGFLFILMPLGGELAFTSHKPPSTTQQKLSEP